MSRYQTRRAAPLPDWLDWFDPRKSQAILDEAYSKSKSRKKAKEIPGSINPDNPKQYWSGTKWLNLDDLPKPGKAISLEIPSSTSEVTAVKTIDKATKDSAVNLETDRSIAATNARSSLITAAEGQASGKGSVGRDLLTLQQMREAQTPVETVKSSSPISTQTNKTSFDPTKLSNLNINYSSPPKNWDAGAAFRMAANTGGGGKGGLFADAKSTANTLDGIKNIAGMIAKLQQEDIIPSISPGEGAGDDDLYGKYYAPNMYA
tara:strand:+ start:48 stop:833 length:786 start_codon:yes stop_codon:yes gene_type:complete